MSTEVQAAAAKPASTRDRLLKAAAEVFREEGYERTRVSEVARRAGLTTGAIYANFRGKSELLREAVTAGSEDVLVQLAAELRAGASYRDLLGILAHRVARASDGPDRTLLLEAFAAARRDPEVAEDLRRMVARGGRRLARTVEQARAAAEIAADVDVEALVRFCQAVAFGYYLLDGLGLPAPASEDWDALVEMVLDGLAPQES